MSGSLFMKEGIRLTGRVFVGQVVQLIVTVIGVAYGIKYVQGIADWIDETRAFYSPLLTPEQVKQVSNSEWVKYTQDDLRISDEAQKFLDLWPERW